MDQLALNRKALFRRFFIIFPPVCEKLLVTSSKNTRLSTCYPISGPHKNSLLPMGKRRLFELTDEFHLSARQPCGPIPLTWGLGQWLCVPPFRVVCLFQTKLNKNRIVSPQRHPSEIGGSFHGAGGGR